MPDELPIHISREELHAVEAPAGFETDGSFDVRLVNHGNSLHVHLHLDDRLSRVARMDATNHYVEGDSERVVRVEVAGNREEDAFGKLKVVSAYGAQTRWVDVEVLAPEEGGGQVQVDESLGKPSPEPEPERTGLRDRPEVLVGAFGLLALAIAGASVAVSGSLMVTAGALAVFGGVVVAALLLLE
ncbi:DUF7524 family protein [Salinirussus salinus]|uniref:DUF7524 family protein n=1 Tax=Salinirussus salinus TaxID=1198300 RepID=UPI00135CAEA1|nr:hypothetical protein [Salinirussus salinus]